MCAKFPDACDALLEAGIPPHPDDWTFVVDSRGTARTLQRSLAGMGATAWSKGAAG